MFGKKTSDDHGHKSGHRQILKPPSVAEQILDVEDPLNPCWVGIGKCQEYAIPLVVGVVVALVYKNVFERNYNHYWGDGIHPDDDDHSDSRRLTSTNDHSNLKLYTIPFCEDTHSYLFGHPISLKFLTNDILMVFFFGLATKEVTEALLPGGSLNPPSKAVNPLMATFGGVFGPIVVFFCLLEVLYILDVFDHDYSFSTLYNGWGVVTATDIPIAWMVARIVFGDGHPAIDYLLLLAVVDDAIGLLIIAIFYPDPERQTEPIWLLLVLLGCFSGYLLRKWHYRISRIRHQSWLLYVMIGGVLCWIGLLKAHLHPALALVPIVPWMPGPLKKDLEHLDHDNEIAISDEIFQTIQESIKQAGLSLPQAIWVEDATRKALETELINSSSRGEIEAGMFAGIVGHGDVDLLKVLEYDDDDEVVKPQVSTLDEFESDLKPWVDFGMFFFALCNAGVLIGSSIGPLTWLIFFSLFLGKPIGIYSMSKVAKRLGYPPPLGVQSRHLRMVGLIGSIGLTVALFVSEVAYEDEDLKGDAKLGALLTGLTGFLAVGIGKVFNFSQDTVTEDVTKHIEERILEAATIAPKNSEGDASGRLAMARISKETTKIFDQRRLHGEANKEIELTQKVASCDVVSLSDVFEEYKTEEVIGEKMEKRLSKDCYQQPPLGLSI